MTDLDLLRGREIGGISVEASGSEEAGPSIAAHLRQLIQLITFGGHGPPRRRHGSSRRVTSRESCRRRSRLATASARQLFVSGAIGRGAATGKRHGRPWPDDVKAQIVAESERPDASISAVARRHGISEKTLRTWRRQAASGAGGDRRGAKSAPPYIPLWLTVLRPSRRSRSRRWALSYAFRWRARSIGSWLWPRAWVGRRHDRGPLASHRVGDAAG